MQIRLLIATLMLLLAMAGKAQVFQINNTPMNFARGLKARDLLIAPKGCDTAALSNPKWGESTAGALFVDTCNNRLYFYNGLKWNQVTGGGGGVDSFYYNFRNLNDTTLLWDRGDGTVDTLAFSSGGTSLIGSYVDSVTTIGDSLYYWKGGTSFFSANLALAAAGGDTTIFEPITDSTGNDNFRVLYAFNGKISGSYNFRYVPTFGRVIISPNAFVSNNYDTVRLAVDGSIYAGKISIRSGIFENISGGRITLSPDSAIITPTPTATDTTTYKPAALSSTGALVRLNRWPGGGGADTTGMGDLFIRNQFAMQEAKTFNIRSGRLDSLYASTWAGYNSNVAANYTARSFTDKNYVDSTVAAVPTVTSYGKNSGGDSTILLLSNGQRFAAKDSTGGGGMTNPMTTTGDLIYSSNNSGTPARLGIGSTGQVLTVSGGVPTWAAASGGGVSTVGTFSGSSQTNGASISGSTITFGPADATNPGMVSTGAQTFTGEKTFSTLINIGPGTYPNLSYRYRSDLTVSGNPFGLWHYLPTSGDFRVHFNNGSFLDNASTASLYLSGSQFVVRVPASFTSLIATSFTTAAGEKLVYNGGTGTSKVGIASAFDDVMHYVPSGNNFRWHNSGQYVNNASAALMFLSAGQLSTTVPANIGTYAAPPTSAIFSTTSTTKGSIPAPIMTNTQRDAISSPAAGLRVFNSTTSQPNYRDGSTWQAQVGMTFGTAAPTSTPTAVGNFFLDTTNKKLYVATGTASSADWTILN